MFSAKTLNQVRWGMEKWLAEVRKTAKDISKTKQFSTVSDLAMKPIHTPEDVKGLDFDTSIGYPGNYPFTRGYQTDGYRGRVWTFRMFSGFGSARDTNQRWHQLLKEGETSLSTAFDMPTMMGYDSDSTKARGEYRDRSFY